MQPAAVCRTRGSAPPAPAPRTPTGRAGTLLIYSKGFDKRIVDLYNEAHFASTGKTKEIDSWPEIMAAIGQYQSINHLVFLVHSRPGMFLFRPDANARMFGDHISLVDAAKKVKALPVKPQIQTVDLGRLQSRISPRWRASVRAGHHRIGNHRHESFS